MGQGVQIGNGLPHTCGTRYGLKAFQQPDGTINGFCFSCGEWVDSPFGDDIKDIPKKKIKTAEEVAAEMKEVENYKTVDVVYRKLRKASLEKFGVKTSLSERDGTTPTALYFPMKSGGVLKGWHVKMVNPPKDYVKAFNIGDTRDIDLLNWDKAKDSGAYTLIITEGPEDMVSVDRIFDMYGDPKWHPAVVSLPWGVATTTRFLTKHAEEIKRLFKKVILSFDDDVPGHKAVKEAMLILPEAKAVVLPRKDANECLIEGVAKLAYDRLNFTTFTPKNTTLIKGMDVHELAKQPAKVGELSWPWKKLNEDMRGIRLGETSYLGAG